MNAGLHDILRKPPDGELNVDRERYEEGLQYVADTVRASGAHLAFLLSTPVRESIANEEGSNARFNEDIADYNGIMRRVAERNDVPVIDLYSLIEACSSECLSAKDGVHVTDRGADVIAEHLEAYLLGVPKTTRALTGKESEGAAGARS